MQAQKMEAVGQLTGGIAHDFNNLLQIIVGNLESAQRIAPPEPPRLRRAVENAMNGAHRAATLTQRLLAFSRRQPLAPKPVSINNLLRGMSEMLDRALGETIRVDTVLEPQLWRTEVDPNQLESAILNLAVNARDAMPSGGALVIETTNVTIDKLFIAIHPGAAPGRYVCISVTDTGTGMDRKTLARAFEPFFTTKDVNKGTGLGLAMVYGFAKQSNGHVTAYSETGRGTTVKLYLPYLGGDISGHDEQMAVQPPDLVPQETILVVEDDVSVRANSVDALRDLGYTVIEAEDGLTALEALDGPAGDSIDLVFTDVVLPGGMTGADIVREARRRRPPLKALFTTGYAREAIVHQGRLDEGVALLTKPFTHADLATKIREMIERN